MSDIDPERSVRFEAGDPNSPIVNAKTRELVQKTYRNGRNDATDAIVTVLMGFNSATRHPSVIAAVEAAGRTGRAKKSASHDS
jgi:hypothetical protein